MLDGLLGRGGFSSKCKSLMKLTKTRIDVIRRKRNATQKFLRKDVADLLASGLDINAYGRAEGLLVEMILSSCYDFVERCCDLVIKHLSVMQKQRDCPEECKAAVASLMLAAARFSDLPELRDLRQTFYERYGDSLALFEDAVFKENLASPPSTLENKVRLMKEISSEYSIKWDSKAFEQRMNKPSVSPQEPPKAHRDFHLGADKTKSSHGKDKVHNGDGYGIMSNARFDHNEGHGKSLNEKKVSVLKVDAPGDYHTRHGLSSNGHDKPPKGWDEPVKKKDDYENSRFARQDYGPERQAQEKSNLKEDALPRSVRSGGSSQRKIEPEDAGLKLHYGRVNNVPIIDCRAALPHAKPEVATSHAKSNGKEKCPDDGFGQHINASPSSKDEAVPKPKSYHNMLIPPPYVKRYDKAKVRKHDSHLGSDGGFDQNGISKDTSLPDRSEGKRIGSDRPGHERQLAEPEVVAIHHHDKDHVHQDDIANPVPKPRSSRRRHSRSRSFQNDAANFEEAAMPLPRNSRSKRRDDQRRGLQVLFDDEHHQRDEEERIIDKLLMHYSKKPSSNPDPGKPRRKSRTRHAHHVTNVVDEFPKERSRDGSDKEHSPHTSRSFSLPREHSGPSTATKVFTRAATFQLERSDGARHVHPKLPDYDDLAARFAALRGR